MHSKVRETLYCNVRETLYCTVMWVKTVSALFSQTRHRQAQEPCTVTLLHITVQSTTCNHRVHMQDRDNAKMLCAMPVQ
jgi:hypothetical protein